MAARAFAFAAFCCIAKAGASCDGGGECIVDADEAFSLLQAATAKRSGRRRTSSSTGCVKPSGSFTTQQVKVGGAITSILAAGDLNVEFSVCAPGASDSVSVRADDAVMPAVSLAQNGGTLTIGYQGCVIGNSRYRKPVVSICGASFVSEVQATSSADFEFKGSATVSSLTLTAESSGKIEIDSVTASKVTAHATSSGKIDLGDSQTDQCVFTTQSSGKIEGGTCNTLEVDASSSSKVEITLTGSASGTVASASKLEVEGPGSASGVTTMSGGKVDVDN